ncbi:hypothetical protein [Candidatus Odyssella thessalonicensis]|uniref:hypothetical protein n=1 Tax=Candidatus Odyssella thessalonicensis TaxID=84647 RepID=UPI000225A9BB|nr:hypothetical protein [Candidatus Odyssella thessalonicensis]
MFGKDKRSQPTVQKRGQSSWREKLSLTFNLPADKTFTHRHPTNLPSKKCRGIIPTTILFAKIIMRAARRGTLEVAIAAWVQSFFSRYDFSSEKGQIKIAIICACSMVFSLFLLALIMAKSAP